MTKQSKSEAEIINKRKKKYSKRDIGKRLNISGLFSLVNGFDGSMVIKVKDLPCMIVSEECVTFRVFLGCTYSPCSWNNRSKWGKEFKKYVDKYLYDDLTNYKEEERTITEFILVDND